MLGFLKRDCDERAEEQIARFKGWSPPPRPPGKVVDWVTVFGWVFAVQLTASNTFGMGALGYTIEHPVLRDWREAGRQLVAAVLYYFFGPWREKVRWHEHSFTSMSTKVLNREQTRAKLQWISFYRDALPAALSLGDWEAADRLLEWPGPDLKDDVDPFNSIEDNAYQIWLAMRLRGDSGSEVDARRDWITRRSRPRQKLLALAADALFAGEPKTLAKTLTDYLEYYRKREIDLQRDPGWRLVRQGISLDGTVLWHLARRRGLGEIKLAEHLMVMIARP
jgi:hypothetical protein